jgi:hypothetical protein
MRGPGDPAELLQKKSERFVDVPRAIRDAEARMG